MIKTSKIRDEIFFDDCFLKIKEVSSTMRSQVNVVLWQVKKNIDLTEINVALYQEF